MAGGKRDSGKERFWRDVMQRWRRCRRSGQRVRAFCAEHGLSEASFYAWQRTIAERDEQCAQSRSVRDEPSAVPAFVPVQVAPTAMTPALEVVVGGDRVIRVTPGFDATTLRHLLAVLEEKPSC
jgi:hypothetical protein